MHALLCAGKGGESIYGKYFEDEIKDTLKHDRRGTISMANRGPNTNGAQFFIAYGPQPHLNNVNTVFGRVRKCCVVLFVFWSMRAAA